MTRLQMPITEFIRRQYYHWITNAGCSCSWDYYQFKDKNYMVVEFVDDEDATAFKLRFKL